MLSPAGIADAPTIISQKRSREEYMSPHTTNTSDYEEEELDELEEDENHPVASSTSAGLHSAQNPTSRPAAGSESNPALLPGMENEYEAGRVICDACGEGVSIRDESTGGFSVAKFKEHKSACVAGAIERTTRSPASAPPPSFTPAAPIRKKRRAKRSEEERIDFFRTDPHVAKFEAYRVLCGHCNKWIRLRSNSSYCSIPWEAHRKSCLSKKPQPKSPSRESTKTVVSPRLIEPRSEPSSSRALCKDCDSWIEFEASEAAAAAQHKHGCPKSITPPKVCHEQVQAQGTNPDGLTPTPRRVTPMSLSNLVNSTAEMSPKSAGTVKASDLNDIRRRNAEQRAAILREDPLVGQVEPLRVFCTICQKWVQLRRDTPYCAYPWQQHRAKCLLRHEKRERDEPEVGSRSDTDRTGTDPFPQDDHPKSKRAKLVHTSSDSEMDDEAPSQDVRNPMTDLETTTGRVKFICQSVEYLFNTTYSREEDEMTIASLVAYLNSALPPDRFEDFDTVEVTRVAAANSLKNGKFIFQGDRLRIAD